MVPRPESVAMSVAQHRCWLNQMANPAGTFYNYPFWFQVEGKLDTGALEQAFDNMIRRHEILRTTFPMNNGCPIQVIHPKSDIDMPVVDLGNLDEKDRICQ